MEKYSLTMEDVIQKLINEPNAELNNDSIKKRANYHGFRILTTGESMPVKSENIETRVEIHYDEDSIIGRIIGRVFVNYAKPNSMFDTRGPETMVLSIIKNRNDRAGLMAAYDICNAAAKAIIPAVKAAASELKTAQQNSDRTVSIIKDGIMYKITGRDLLHRRNRARLYSCRNGLYIRQEQLSKNETIEAIVAVQNQYHDTLTDHESTRLNKLLGEYKGLIPTFKDRQKAIRESNS